MAEEQIPKNDLQQDPKRDWRLRINYQWIVQNVSYFLFLAVLALLYIANNHYAEKNIRAINKTSKEVKELRWKYIDVKSDLMFRSKLSEVSSAVAPMGLKELNAPPKKITVEEVKK